MARFMASVVMRNPENLNLYHLIEEDMKLMVSGDGKSVERQLLRKIEKKNSVKLSSQENAEFCKIVKDLVSKNSGEKYSDAHLNNACALAAITDVSTELKDLPDITADEGIDFIEHIVSKGSRGSVVEKLTPFRENTVAVLSITCALVTWAYHAGSFGRFVRSFIAPKKLSLKKAIYELFLISEHKKPLQNYLNFMQKTLTLCRCSERELLTWKRNKVLPESAQKKIAKEIRMKNDAVCELKLTLPPVMLVYNANDVVVGDKEFYRKCIEEDLTKFVEESGGETEEIHITTYRDMIKDQKGKGIEVYTKIPVKIKEMYENGKFSESCTLSDFARSILFNHMRGTAVVAESEDDAINETVSNGDIASVAPKNTEIVIEKPIEIEKPKVILLDVGETMVDPKKINEHEFTLGSSGSGKSYALAGAILGTAIRSPDEIESVKAFEKAAKKAVEAALALRSKRTIRKLEDRLLNIIEEKASKKLRPEEITTLAKMVNSRLQRLKKKLDDDKPNQDLIELIYSQIKLKLNGEDYIDKDIAEIERDTIKNIQDLTE